MNLNSKLRLTAPCHEECTCVSPTLLADRKENV